MTTKLALVLALAVSSIAFIGAKSFHKTHDGTVPIVVEMNPPTPTPNSEVQVTVELDAPCATGHV